MKKIWLLLLFLLVIFNNVLEFNVPLGTFWDELVVIIVIMVAIAKSGFKIKKKNLADWGLLLVVVVCGVVGNIINPTYQSECAAIFKDILAITKFFIVSFLLRDQSIGNRNDIKRSIVITSKILIVITVFAAFVGYFIDLSFYTGEIRIVKTFKFIYSHPTFFVSAYVILLSVMILDSIDKNRMFIILDCILLFLAQRTKGYLIIIVAISLLILGEKKVQNLFSRFVMKENRIKMSKKTYILFGIIAIAGLIIGKDKINDYLGWGLTAARPALYIVGIRLLVDNFPFGSGFGTFASSISGAYYSNVYAQYNISMVSGLRIDAHNYIADVFWPYVYGQLGVIGVIVYIVLLIRLVSKEMSIAFDFNSKIAIMFLFIYALIASTSEAFFTNSSGVQYALFIGMFLAGNRRRDLYEQK